MDEQLGAWGGGEDFTRLRACEITLDRSRSTATWRVDGRTVYETRGTFLPERVRIGFGSRHEGRTGPGGARSGA